jgi:hypothetical protein
MIFGLTFHINPSELSDSLTMRARVIVATNEFRLLKTFPFDNDKTNAANSLSTICKALNTHKFQVHCASYY